MRAAARAGMTAASRSSLPRRAGRCSWPGSTLPSLPCVYDTPYKNPVQEVAYPGFRAIGEREVQGTITVPHDQLEALFAMTPYYWKTPRDGAARLAALPELTTDIAFRFLLFEKL